MSRLSFAPWKLHHHLHKRLRLRLRYDAGGPGLLDQRFTSTGVFTTPFFLGKNSGDNKCETTSVVFAPLGSEFGPHCFAGRSICATSSKRENQAELVSMAVFFKLIYANNAYLVNVSKIRHPLGICTATNTVINERALRCKDFIASSP